ncbi:MAG: T9SS type A sorting domain-containing protein [Bacteroidales bacterium]|nr:T9SS type A sorting domain-containing protein [Lentimicrobiaceae bacterium]MDD5694312.1 T9SS type A sorting domain-containing protein [Bacteroidales bacterium]
MKNQVIRIRLSLLFLLILNILQAQEYMPFPHDSAIWYTVYSYPWPNPPYVWYYTYQYETDGDTIINQLFYTKLYNGIVGSGYRFYDGAYRIDYESERVYYVDPMYGTESLLYDFKLVPGDTISIINGGIEACKMVCLDTSSMIINGVSHFSLFMYAFSEFADCYTIWLKGIGSLSMPLETDIFCGHSFENAFDLTCFYYKGEEIYKWEGNPYFGECFGNNVGIQEFRLPEIIVAPNPVTSISKLFYKSRNNTICDYQIMDINGSICQSGVSKEISNIIINASNYNTGIYLIKLYIVQTKEYYLIKFLVK